MGVAAALTRGRIFPDVDRAIEWAEEHLILSRLGDVESGVEFPFARLEVFTGMSEDELTVVKSALSRRTYGVREIIFREGRYERRALHHRQGQRERAPAAVGPRTARRADHVFAGTVFGEVALLDREARSATVEADEALVCYVLTRENFERLTAEHPLVAIKLLTNLGREISGRLRRANRTIYQLAS
jgi:CRP-like cAMP-binding protein